MNKTLIINADDFGMTIPISLGIIKAHRAGLVKSTSAITTSKDFISSIDELKSLGVNIDIGLHANLTWGKPVLNPTKIKTLINENGNFFPKASLLIKSLSEKISEKEVYEELSAQCEILKAKVGKISHLDSHHHTHIFPIIRNAVEKVAKDFGIKIIRAPREYKWQPWHVATVKRFSINCLKSSNPKYWRSKGFVSTDNFGGFNLGYSSNLKQKWINTLKILPKGITEIMVHPGYKSENNDSYNLQRESEIEVLIDNELIDYIKNNQIIISSFKEMLGE